jgi:hypothetical protein
MNTRIKELAEQAETKEIGYYFFDKEKFAESIILECANICEEMAAKCAGLEGDGALAKDCAYWIKKHFGVE